MATKYVQAPTLYIAGSGTLIGATTVTLTSLTDIYGNVLTMADFGAKGYITLEPDTNNEEAAIFTGITANPNGTYTLTGVSTILAKDPYTEASGLVRQHSGGLQVVITDNVGFWNTFGNTKNTNTWDDVQTFNEYPQMDSVAVPPTLDEQLATKKYVDDIAIAGAPDASTTVKGIGKTSVAPVSPTNPVFVGDNDPRVPTVAQVGYIPSSGQKDALAGTVGAPSAANPYITNNDAPGTGNVIRVSTLPAGSTPTDIQTFTATGANTWTKPTGAKKILVQLWGGGGSGSHGGGSASAGGTGGSGGEYFEQWFDASSLGASETVTIATGGAAKLVGGNGNNGGNTTFGSLATAYGGLAGIQAAASTLGSNGGSHFGPVPHLYGIGTYGDGLSPVLNAYWNNSGVYSGASGGTYWNGGVVYQETSGGSSYYGGGGGGSHASSGSSSYSSGGTSVYGGNGSSASSGTSSAGATPGGGSGHGVNGSGAGGDGKAIVTTFF